MVLADAVEDDLHSNPCTHMLGVRHASMWVFSGGLGIGGCMGTYMVHMGLLRRRSWIKPSRRVLQ